MDTENEFLCHALQWGFPAGQELTEREGVQMHSLLWFVLYQFCAPGTWMYSVVNVSFVLTFPFSIYGENQQSPPETMVLHLYINMWVSQKRFWGEYFNISCKLLALGLL